MKRVSRSPIMTAGGAQSDQGERNAPSPNRHCATVYFAVSDRILSAPRHGSFAPRSRARGGTWGCARPSGGTRRFHTPGPRCPSATANTSNRLTCSGSPRSQRVGEEMRRNGTGTGAAKSGPLYGPAWPPAHTSHRSVGAHVHTPENRRPGQEGRYGSNHSSRRLVFCLYPCGGGSRSIPRVPGRSNHGGTSHHRHDSAEGSTGKGRGRSPASVPGTPSPRPWPYCCLSRWARHDQTHSFSSRGGSFDRPATTGISTVGGRRRRRATPG